jgi:hypothetical protein
LRFLVVPCPFSGCWWAAGSRGLIYSRSSILLIPTSYI